MMFTLPPLLPLLLLLLFLPLPLLHLGIHNHQPGIPLPLQHLIIRHHHSVKTALLRLGHILGPDVVTPGGFVPVVPFLVHLGLVAVHLLQAGAAEHEARGGGAVVSVRRGGAAGGNGDEERDLGFSGDGVVVGEEFEAIAGAAGGRS